MEPRGTAGQMELQARRRSWGWVVALGGAMVLAGGGGALLLQRQSERAAPAPVAEGRVAPAAAEKAEPLPPTPSLDARVRQLLAGASAQPLWADFLRQQGVLQRFVATVATVADGESPRELLGFLAPRGRFQVRERGGRTFIAPASYARYDAVGHTVASLDAGVLAGAYRALKPVLDRVHREVVRPGRTLDQTLARAFAHVLAVPRVTGEVEVVSAGALYVFADPTLEELSPAQKHLLRMGPRTLGALQDKVRQVAAALEAGAP